ncbi:hypothetical protein HMI56_004237, partial [Coelomomyces lativittatus]
VPIDIDQLHHPGNAYKNPVFLVNGSMTYGIPPGINSHGQMMDDGSNSRIPQTLGPHKYHKKGHPME